ncbi:hypothetical protein LMG31506_03602 [Cupriavidus yeoncheonensis]|uniref:Uncharacterized protein n=1 Tax=Cupriavidus yeoncheonensis TaxID=1462994 RepID=A0A916MW49_9BURK|nr:hypothetical protein LMG31506_03602 [Cupriavidus yeoncheonensis]
MVRSAIDYQGQATSEQARFGARHRCQDSNCAIGSANDTGSCNAGDHATTPQALRTEQRRALMQKLRESGYLDLKPWPSTRAYCATVCNHAK